MEQKAASRASTRRRHAPEFKSQVVYECNQPGATVAAVALSHALHPSLVRRWRRLAGQGAQGEHGTPRVTSATPEPLTPPADTGAGTGKGTDTSTDIGQPPAVASNTTAAKVVSAARHAGAPDGTSGTFIALAHPSSQARHRRHAPAPVGQACAGQVDSIHVDILRTHAHIHVRWPASAASDCALWLKDLLHDPHHSPHQDPYQGPRADVSRRGAPK